MIWRMVSKEQEGLTWHLLSAAELNSAGRRVNQVHTLAGTSTLRQQLCGLDFQLSPLAFFQTNSTQAEVMYNMVAEAAGICVAAHSCTLSLGNITSGDAIAMRTRHTHTCCVPAWH